jgi:hypothetical protein
MQIQFKKTIINSQLNSKRQKGPPLSAPYSAYTKVGTFLLRGKDSIGRVAADGKAGADYAGSSKGCGRGKKLVGVSSEAWAVVGWKSTDETV